MLTCALADSRRYRSGRAEFGQTLDHLVGDARISLDDASIAAALAVLPQAGQEFLAAGRVVRVGARVRVYQVEPEAAEVELIRERRFAPLGFPGRLGDGAGLLL